MLTSFIYSFQNISQNIICIRIGEQRERFNVHLDLLCKNSPDLSDIIKRTRRECQRQNLHLLDVKPATFRLFLDWLYFQTKFFKDKRYDEVCPNCDDCPGEVDQKIRYVSLIDNWDNHQDLELIINKTEHEVPENALYAFAVKYNTPQLRREIIGAAWKIRKDVPPRLREVIYLLRIINQDDVLLQLLIESLTSRKNPANPFRCPFEAKMVYKLPKRLLCQLWLAGRVHEWGVAGIDDYLETLE